PRGLAHRGAHSRARVDPVGRRSRASAGGRRPARTSRASRPARGMSPPRAGCGENPPTKQRREMTSIEERLRAVEDRLALIELEALYARSFDEHDGETWSGLFASDGVYQSRPQGD